MTSQGGDSRNDQETQEEDEEIQSSKNDDTKDVDEK